MKTRDVIKLVEQDAWQPSPIQTPDEEGPSNDSRPSVEGNATGNFEKCSEAGRFEMKYAVIFERSSNGYGAYVPDLPGCVAVGDTLDETQQLIREAIELHLKGMREDGEPIPVPTTIVRDVEIRVLAGD